MNIEIQDASKLVADGNTLSAKAQEFKTEITNIYSIIDDLKNSWTGDSARKYTDNIEKFRTEFEQFAAAIEQFGEIVKTVGNSYLNLESEL